MISIWLAIVIWFLTVCFCIWFGRICPDIRYKWHAFQWYKDDDINKPNVDKNMKSILKMIDDYYPRTREVRFYY